jgi:hypothetical protein
MYKKTPVDGVFLAMQTLGEGEKIDKEIPQ